MLFRRSKSITPTRGADAMGRGALQIVDVRETAELAEASIDGATHIPLGQLPSRLRELDRERPVAFVCASGARSAMATRSAAKAGLDASNIEGGIEAWARAGLPLTTPSRGGAA